MATQKKNSWQSIARLRGRITTPTQATSAYRGAVEWDARFHRARVFPCSSMLIMRPMRSRGNEVMCVCVCGSECDYVARCCICKRTSCWCLLGLLPSQLSTTLREHGENLCISSLGSARLDCIAPTKTRNAFLNRRAVFKLSMPPSYRSNMTVCSQSFIAICFRIFVVVSLFYF